MAINEKYSYKDFTGQYLTEEPASDFNNSEIVGSCFHIGNEPFSKVFPAGMTGVTFTMCSLGNCIVPPGNIVYVKKMPIAPSPGVKYLIDAKKGFLHRHIENRNDMEQWVVDENRNPVEPLRKKMFQDLGLSIDPKDIPITKQDTMITIQKEQDNHQADIDAVKAWNPEIAERLGIK